MLAPVPCLTCLPAFDGCGAMGGRKLEIVVGGSSWLLALPPVHLPVSGRLMRFLSLSWRFSEDEVEVIDAEDEEGEETVESVEDVDERCRSTGDAFSSPLSVLI